MKKIIIVCTQLEAGGAQRAALRLAKYLKNENYLVENWFLYKKRDVFEDVPELEIVYPNKINSIKELLIFFKDLFKKLRASKPDVVITFGHYSNIITQIVALIAGIKIRIASHRNPRWGYMSKLQQLIDKIWARLGVYHEITAVSKSTRDSFTNYPEHIFKKIQVIENGLEFKSEVKKDKSEARKYFNFPNDAFIVGNVGRLSDQKNQKTLIKAISLLEKEVHLAIAGEGELRGELENYASELQISHRVHLIGEIEYEKMPLFFKSIDIFAMPSKFEGLSNALIEAMSYSLPVICSSIDAQKDVLIGDEGTTAGKLLVYDQPDKWAKAIEDIKNDKDKYQELKEKAKCRSLDFTIDKMGNAFLQLIERRSI